MILVVDSCACGVRSLPALQAALPSVQLLYFADYAINPLGARSDDEIITITKRWAEAMAGVQGAPTGLVVACNTASVVMEQRRSEVILPRGAFLVSMVDATRELLRVKKSAFHGRRVLLLGTRATCRNQLYHKLINAGGAHVVRALSTPEAERVVAKGLTAAPGSRPQVMGELSAVVEWQCDTVVLGCTCFGVLIELYREFFGLEVQILDPLDYIGSAATQHVRFTSQLGEGCGRILLTTSGDDRDRNLLGQYASTCLDAWEMIDRQAIWC